MTACHIHHQAVGLAFDWLGDARQTPETIRRALDDLKALPPLPNLVETLQVESSIIERSLDLSANELADALVGSSSQSRPLVEYAGLHQAGRGALGATRARRVCRTPDRRGNPDRQARALGTRPRWLPGEVDSAGLQQLGTGPDVFPFVRQVP